MASEIMFVLLTAQQDEHAHCLYSIEKETHPSDIARFKQKQALEEEAAQRGLTGLASVANHESITARMQHSTEYLLKLLEEGKHAEVAQLMEQDWGLEGLAP